MIKLLNGLPSNVVAFTATGQITGEDYKNVLVPTVEKKFKEHDKIRILYHLGPEFKKFTTTALWDDARVGFHHLTGFERIAVVSDVKWIRTMAQGIGLAMPGAVRTFANSELEQAKDWISA